MFVPQQHVHPRRTRTAAKAPTRADVARLSGVSTAVVSYVLNGGPKPVAAPTREKVLAAVRALNYRPNAAARALSRGSADSIGLLVGDSLNPFFAELIDAVDERVRQVGRSLLTATTEHSSLSPLEHIDELAAQRVSGILSVHAVNPDERSRLAALGIPTVLINQEVPQDGFSAVLVDYAAGARTAVEHLIGHGFTDIAFVGAHEGAHLRESGWAAALAAAGLRARHPYVTSFSLAGGYRAGLLLAAENIRPQAVFVSSDQMAMGLLAALDEQGLHVPDDIAVVSFDGTAESAYLIPALTTVRQPVDAIAETAIALLGENDTAPHSRYITPELLVRRSCGCTTWSRT